MTNSGKPLTELEKDKFTQPPPSVRTACGTRSGRARRLLTWAVLSLGINRLRFDSAPDHMEDKNKTLTPDEDYRDPDGCGCVVSIALVIVIFAIAAGLWLFTN